MDCGELTHRPPDCRRRRRWRHERSDDAATSRNVGHGTHNSSSLDRSSPALCGLAAECATERPPLAVPERAHLAAAAVNDAAAAGSAAARPNTCELTAAVGILHRDCGCTAAACLRPGRRPGRSRRSSSARRAARAAGRSRPGARPTSQRLAVSSGCNGKDRCQGEGGKALARLRAARLRAVRLRRDYLAG